jgi:predicted membrane protein
MDLMNNPTRHRSWISGMRGRVSGALALVILLGLAVVALPSAQAQNFTTFNAPGAGTTAYEGTVSLSMNTAGDITGVYIAAGTVYHGFVRAANGVITTFDVTGAGTGKNQGTYPFSINTAGVIAGMYADSSNGYHGFVRAKNGKITSFDVPGAIADFHLGTAASSINTAGDVTGMYRDSSFVHHGFIRAANGTLTYPIDVSGAGTGEYQGTEPISINTAGDITGYYVDKSGANHGFVRAADGTITTFDVTGAGTGSGQGTTGFSIDTAGTIVGAYADSSDVSHGFVRAANGTITTFDAPGAGVDYWLALLGKKASGIPTQGTGGFSINTAGDVTGTYADSSEVVHGFVRSAKGAITTFSVPGAGTGMLQGTLGISINTAQDIAGTYLDANSVFHGFVLPPPAVTTTTLTSSPNPSTYGQSVTFTATVTSKLGAPPDGETVTFMKGTTVLGTGTLSGGSASYATSALKVGTNAIKAVYPGDPSFAPSTSKPVSQVVGKAATTTTLVSSLNPSNSGQSVTFTASVTPQSGGTATGKVAFYDGTTLLKSVALSGGEAKYTTAKLTVGAHKITATYSGSTTFDGSSASLTQTVN